MCVAIDLLKNTDGAPLAAFAAAFAGDRNGVGSIEQQSRIDGRRRYRSVATAGRSNTTAVGFGVGAGSVASLNGAG